MKNHLSITMGKIVAIVIILALSISNDVFAQSNMKESLEYENQKEIYNRAIRYNDLAVAKNAIYNLMAMDPQNVSLLDSLALMYFEFQQFPSSLLVSRDILAINPDHLAALEISAISYERLGIKDRALEAYESLYLKNNSISTLYKIAFLQFDLNRIEESKTTADIILNKTEVDELKVVYNTADNKQREIPMKAAILNLKGLINKEQGDKEAARENFEAALALDPEFTLAKSNLDALNEE